MRFRIRVPGKDLTLVIDPALKTNAKKVSVNDVKTPKAKKAPAKDANPPKQKKAPPTKPPEYTELPESELADGFLSDWKLRNQRRRLLQLQFQRKRNLHPRFQLSSNNTNQKGFQIHWLC